MLIFNLDYIREYLTNNQEIKVDNKGNQYVEHKEVPYRWTHGLTDLTLGDGLLVYSIIHYMSKKLCLLGKWWWIYSKNHDTTRFPRFT